MEGAHWMSSKAKRETEELLTDMRTFCKQFERKQDELRILA